MSFVPGCEQDVFVSYAHIDDRPYFEPGPERSRTEAYEILKRLEDAGTLWPSEEGWIAKVETALAENKT
jgi:hypothetical protein